MGEKTLVWAKMKSFCAWPGVVVDTPPDVLKRQQPKSKDAKCVFFFGSKNFAWIDGHHIHSYKDNREKFAKASKSVSFREAIRMIEEYISDPETYNSHSEPEVPVEKPPKTPVVDKFNELRDSGEPENGDVTADDDGDKSVLSGRSAPSSTKKSAKKRPAMQLKFPGIRKKAIKEDPQASTPITPPPKRRRNDSPSPVVEQIEGSSSNRYRSFSGPRSDDVVSHILNRPNYDVHTESADSNHVSTTNPANAARLGNINASALHFGFLGLGIMGSGIVKNLIGSRHKVTVWNRTMDKCDEFVALGCHVAQTPCDVIDAVDITFSCVSDPAVARDLVFGNCGVLASENLSDGKAYVEMTGVDDVTSQDIAEAISNKGGRYLEAMLQGSKQEAENGSLVVIAGGEKTVFDECQSCFEAISKNSFFLGEVGFATKMYLTLQLVTGTALAGLAEGMALAQRAGLELKDVIEILELTDTSSNLLINKGRDIINNQFHPKHPLQHMQKDLKLVMGLSEQLGQPLPITSSVNEQFKNAKRNGYSEHDSCAVYIKNRI